MFVQRRVPECELDLATIMANLQPTVFTIEDNLQLCQIVYNLGAINWDHISYKMNEWGQIRGKPVVMKPMVGLRHH